MCIKTYFWICLDGKKGCWKFSKNSCINDHKSNKQQHKKAAGWNGRQCSLPQVYIIHNTIFVIYLLCTQNNKACPVKFTCVLCHCSTKRWVLLNLWTQRCPKNGNNWSSCYWLGNYSCCLLCNIRSHYIRHIILDVCTDWNICGLHSPT